jgi:hypothetical protein
VGELLAKAEAADKADVPDGMSIPEELERREQRLKKLAEARAEIEARTTVPRLRTPISRASNSTLTNSSSISFKNRCRNDWTTPLPDAPELELAMGQLAPVSADR